MKLKYQIMYYLYSQDGSIVSGPVYRRNADNGNGYVDNRYGYNGYGDAYWTRNRQEAWAYALDVAESMLRKLIETEETATRNNNYTDKYKFSLKPVYML